MKTLEEKQTWQLVCLLEITKDTESCSLGME